MRLKRLRQAMKEKEIEALLITNPLNRRYLSGFTGTAGYLLISETAAYLLTDGRYTEQAKNQATQFEVISRSERVLETVADLLQQERVSTLGFESDHLTVAEYQQLKTAIAPVATKHVRQLVEELRMIKDEQEIECIKRAIRVVDEVFVELLAEIAPGMTEHHVATRMEYLMREKGASGSSFDTIVASGVRSALPHGVASEKMLANGELVTLDFGCYVDGYTSDLTRTFVLGTSHAKQREIYDIVLESQQKTIAALRPGMTGREADQIARRVIEEAGYGEAFAHGLGHGIGLDIHEEPSLRRSSEQVLQPGMVVTIEPGIYLPGFGGVRIEDDVLITNSGATVLTTATKEWLTMKNGG
jgi:Xaa-Pro aminopeptidase